MIELTAWASVAVCVGLTALVLLVDGVCAARTGRNALRQRQQAARMERQKAVGHQVQSESNTI